MSLVTATPDTLNTRVLLNFTLNPDDWAGYDSLQLCKSTVSSAGPYEDLTARTYLPATLPSTVDTANSVDSVGASPRNLQGTSLKLRVNKNYILTHDFTTADPYTLHDIAAALNAQYGAYIQAVVYLVQGLVIESVLTGSRACLEVLECDAAVLLDLTIGDVSYGRDPHIPLASNRSTYAYEDINAHSIDYYRYRFYNRLDLTVTEWSTPIPAKTTARMPSSELVVGYLQLADLSGNYLKNEEVVVTNVDIRGILHNGVALSGSLQRVLTDENGYAELYLVRGLTVDVALMGTSLVRTITIPDDPTIERFNMLDPNIASQDAFTVAVPTIQYAARRSF